MKGDLSTGQATVFEQHDLNDLEKNDCLYQKKISQALPSFKVQRTGILVYNYIV